MENKSHLIRVTKIKLIIMSLSTLLPIILLILFELPFFTNFEVYRDLVVLRYAFFVLLEAYIGFKIYKYIRILCDIEYCELTILRKNDERLNYIKLRTNAMVIKIFIYVCGIALIVAGFFNSFVFYTLLCVLTTVLLIFVSIFIYFRKKY